MRILILLTISVCTLSAINISSDGLGNDSKWNIKAQTGQPEPEININDDNEFSVNDNEGKLGENINNEDHPIDSNEDGSNTYNRTGSSGSLGSIFDPPSDSGNSSPTPVGGTKVDTDDDVPMLTEIKAVLKGYETKLDKIAQEETQEKIELAIKSISNDINATRGDITDGNSTRKATLADIYGSIKDIQGVIEIPETGYTKATTLADLHNQLVQLNEGNRSQEDLTSEQIAKAKEDTDEASNVITQLAESYVPMSVDDISAPETSVMLDWDFGNGLESFDLLNMSDKFHGSYASVETAGGYIKKFLGWVVAFLFILAMKNAGLNVLEEIPKFTTSAPVTNWSILGNSAGALVAKSTYLAIAVAFIGIIGTNLAIITDEAQLLGDIGSGFSSIGNALSALASGQGFMSESFKWLTIFVPVTSIFTTIGSYYGFKLTTWCLINVQLFAMRAVT